MPLYHLALALSAATSATSQPNVMIVAQAYDRCMATQAVRLTRTIASDDEIFTRAVQTCAALRTELVEALERELPANQAETTLSAMNAQAKPKFMRLLARIRFDRAKRPSN